MAVLAGQPRKLGLTNAPDAQNKQLVFVKLTDTSLEALTNFIKHANKVRLYKIWRIELAILNSLSNFQKSKIFANVF